MRRTRLSSFVLISLALASISCGGGGGNNGGGNNGGGTPPPATLTITSKSPLPASLQGHAYSTTLTATGGQPPYHWSIARVTPFTQFVDGLAIDASTGVLSGTPTFLSTSGFTATVTDSASHTATAGFNITNYQQLTSASAQTATVSEFTSPFNVRSGIVGGYPPVTYTVNSGTMVPGMKFDGNGQLVGSAYALGTYQFTISARDSYSPPETASQSFTITVLPPPFSVATAVPFHAALNRPYNGRIFARGGTPPYSFVLGSGDGLPTGLSLDATTGVVTGTPTVKGGKNFNIVVSDSSVPAQQQTQFLSIFVDVPLGRNDSPATATPIDNGGFFASISPYIDPPNGPPTAADNDYYKLVSLTGATVHVETTAKRVLATNNPLDTVIEIVDGNGIRLNSCRQPGDTTPNFTGSCINDDISASPHVQDSALDFLVVGPSGTSATFYVHVFDWRGDARPDMTYGLQVSGVLDPLVIVPPRATATNGQPYSATLLAQNAHGTVSWSIPAGTLPPGLTLVNGVLSGTPTTDGSYSFTLQASDTGPPPQVATAQETIVVADPVKINLPGNALQSACVNTPYSFTVPTTGGNPPFLWFFSSAIWPNVTLDPNTGTFSGTPKATGTFTGFLTVQDSAISLDSQTVTLTVQQCP